MFAHNGTVSNYKELLKLIPKKYLPRPDSLDTEVLFRYLIEGFPGRLKPSLRRVERGAAYSSLNFLFADGKKLYAYRRSSKWPGYYTLLAAKKGSSFFISSEPVLRAIKWRMIGQGGLARFSTAGPG